MRNRLLFIGTILFLAAVVASATTVIPMSVDKITRLSTLVAEVRAVGSHSAWNAEHNNIYTYTEFQVTRVLKGTQPTKLVVKQLGGSVDGITEHVSGVRYWSNGEEAVLFLHPSTSNDGTHVVTGLMQGNFAVDRLASGEAVTGNGVPDVTSFDSGSGSLSSYRGARMTLRELESQVQRAVQK